MQIVYLIGALSDMLNVIFQFIQAIGALATFGAFLFLFKKDTDKQKQIDKLALLAEKMDAQNEILKESNVLVERQLNLMALSSNNNSNGQSINHELATIEKQKLKLSVKPIIKTQGSRVRGNDGLLQLHIVNVGKRANLLETRVISNDIQVQQINAHLPYALEGNADRWLFFESINGTNPNNAEYEIHLIYADELKNKFKTIIKGNGGQCKVVDTTDYE